MVILRNKQIDNFISHPPDGVKGILIYGQDHGLISSRANSLLSYFVQDKTDPFQLSKLDNDILKKDPDRLVSDLETYSLLGQRKVVYLQLMADLNKDHTKEILESHGGTLILVTANELRSTSALRRGFENEKDLIAIPCYTNTKNDISNYLNEQLRSYKIDMTMEAKNFVISSLGDDYGNTVSEIEKIITSQNQQNKIISLEDVEKIIVDSASVSANDLIDTVFEKKVLDVSVLYNRCLDEYNSSQILSLTLSHIIRLLDLNELQKEKNAPTKQIIEQYKPIIFFKRHLSIQRQLSLWDDTSLLQSMEIVSDATKDIRHYASLDKDITERCLLKVSNIKRSS